MSGKTINLRVTGELERHIDRQVGEDGPYDTTSEYVRDLIRHDLTDQKEAWNWLKSHLDAGMRADPSEFVSVSAEDVINRNKSSS